MPRNDDGVLRHCELSVHHSNIHIKRITREKHRKGVVEMRVGEGTRRGLKGNPHKSLIYGWKWPLPWDPSRYWTHTPV